MGLIKLIKELSAAKKYILTAMEEQDKKNAEYAAMSTDELSALPDDDLLSAVLYRCDVRIRESGRTDEAECAEILNETARTVYVLSVWDAEIQNGGLCQFFVNSTRTLAPLINPSLSKIGAEEHRALFDRFVTENSLDLSDLSFFILKNRACYAEKYTRYPFETFDNAYSVLPPLEQDLIRFIRSNISQF